MQPSDTTSLPEGEEQQHEADYWVVPSTTDSEPSAHETKLEETTYITTLASWLVYALSPARHPVAEGKKRKRAEEDESLLEMEEGARGRVVRGLLEGCGARIVAEAVRCYEGVSDASSGPR